MRAVVVSALVGALVSGGIVATVQRTATPPAAPAVTPFELSYTLEQAEDAWVDGARTTGTDQKSLAAADSAVCFLTKIEIGGIQAPADVNTCAVGIDDFTGYWILSATVAEGGVSQVRCNARCLTWPQPE